MTGPKITFRFFLSLASGAVGSLAFQSEPVSGISWIWPFLMLAVVNHSKSGWLSGYTSGFGFFSTSMYWLWFNPFPQGAILGWFAMSLYCGLYFALWVGLSLRLWESLLKHVDADYLSSKNYRGFSLLIDVSRKPWPKYWQRLSWCVFASCLWVALEWLRCRVITGLPWNLLGMTQSSLSGISTIAQWSGVSLVSFLVCFVSLVIGMACISIVKYPGKPMSGIREAFPVLIIFVGVVFNHFHQISLAMETSKNTLLPELRVSCVQPGFSQNDIWSSDKTKRAEMWQHVMDLTKEAANHQPAPDLILWPEGAVSGMTVTKLEEVSKIAKEKQIAFIISMSTASRDPENPKNFLEYNSAVFIDENGKWLDKNNDWLFVYNKQHLVPFGEFIPLVSLFPWLADILPIGEFNRGTEPGIFYWKKQKVHIGTSICFEDAMAPLIRKNTSHQTQILINLTNDAWFGRSSAQWQHIRAAQFRAIEMGIPIVKAANNGISCWASQFGFLNDIRFDNSPKKSVYDAGYKAFKIKIRPPRHTFYKAIGDWWSILCIGITIVCLIINEIPKRSSSSGSCDPA